MTDQMILNERALNEAIQRAAERIETIQIYYWRLTKGSAPPREETVCVIREELSKARAVPPVETVESWAAEMADARANEVGHGLPGNVQHEVAEPHLPGCKRQDRHEPCQVECDPEPSPDLKAVCIACAEELSRSPVTSSGLLAYVESRAEIIERHLSPYLAQREAADKARIMELAHEVSFQKVLVAGGRNKFQRYEAQVSRLRETLKSLIRELEKLPEIEVEDAELQNCEQLF